MNSETDSAAFDRLWRGLEVHTTGQVSTSKRTDLKPGDVVIIPGIPSERASVVHFMLEGHPLKLEWQHGLLAPGAETPPREPPWDQGS